MIAVILAAGFGTRCRPLTADKPKSLLPLGADTVIDEQVKWLFSCAEITKIVIVSNQKFYNLFLTWREGHLLKNKIEIISDGVTHENHRLGAVGDLKFACEHYPKLANILILGSDNLFEAQVDGVVDDFKYSGGECATVAVHAFKKSLAAIQPNEVILNKQNIITHFKEKPPRPATPDFASLLYIFPQKYICSVAEYIAEGNNPDNAGSFIEWLVRNKYTVRGFKMSGRRFDIGDVKSYRTTQEMIGQFSL